MTPSCVAVCCSVSDMSMTPSCVCLDVFTCVKRLIHTLCACAHLRQAEMWFVCCSVLQCVAVQCSVLQDVAVCCSVLKCVPYSKIKSDAFRVAMCCSVMQYVAALQPKGMKRCESFPCTKVVLQCVAVCCSVLQYAIAVCCSMLQYVAVCQCGYSVS